MGPIRSRENSKELGELSQEMGRLARFLGPSTPGQAAAEPANATRPCAECWPGNEAPAFRPGPVGGAQSLRRLFGRDQISE